MSDFKIEYMGTRSVVCPIGASGERIKDLVIDASVRITLERSHRPDAVLEVRDIPQCCEDRFFHTDDDISAFIGATFEGLSMGGSDYVEHGYKVYEIAFLYIYTRRGIITIEAHNEHNGYYSGFDIEVSMNSKKSGS